MTDTKKKVNLRRPTITKVKLGDMVVDEISGFEGIVTSITTFVAGCKRIGVKSQKLIDGKPIGTQVFDEQLLNITDRNIIIPAKQVKKTIKLGDKIECVINKHTGIAVSMTEYINGDITIGLAPEEVKDGKPEEPTAYDIGMLKKVKKQKIKKREGNTGGDQKISVAYGR